MLDTSRLVTTPELIELRLHPAGFLPRALAAILDLMIRLTIIAAAGASLASLGRFGNGLMLLLYFLLEWFYPVLFEVLGKGATPGKRALQLRVVFEDGTPVGWGPSLTRNLLRAADFLPFAYAFGITSMLLHHEFRRLGDIVARTLVVYQQPDNHLAAIAAAEAIVPPQALNRASQRALLAFAQRCSSLTPARQEELADLLPQLSHSSHTPRGAARLLGIANFLLGRRQ